MHLKAQFKILHSLLSAPQTISNTYAQVTRTQSCANYMQHIKRLSHATCRVTCHVVRRDSSAVKFDRVPSITLKTHHFIHAMIFTRILCDCLLVGCLASQQQASVSQGRICTDNFTCCHTEIEVADQTFYLTQSSIPTPGRPVPVLTLQRQAPGRVATGVLILKSLVWLDPEKILAQAGFEPGIFRSRGGRLSTRPTRWWILCDRISKTVCALPRRYVSWV